MQRKFIVIFMLLIYFYIDSVRTEKIINNQSAIITSGQITKIKKSEKISKFEAYSSHPLNNINSTGPVLFSEIKSNNNNDTHGENSTDKLLTIKEKNNSVNAANSLKLMNKTDYDMNENDSDTFKEANQSVQASHKSFVRQVNSKTHGDNVRVYENPEESLSTKSYSEKDFIPSPEFKIDNLNSDEHRNFDIFQPINIGGYNSKIEPKQEFHQNYHHLTENPYHKFEENSRQKFPSENEEYAHAHVTHTVTNYKPPSTKNIVVHQQLIPSYSSISWPEYQHTDVEKNHHFDQHNVENKNKNSEIEITNFKQHHDHDLQSYNNDHHYASTSEIPPAPVTEDVRDIRSEHPYPFEIVTEKEKDIKFNHDPQKEYEIRYPHDEIIYTTASTSPPTNFKNHHVTEIWDSKHVPDHHIKNPGKILPKKEPWKDILQVLTAIVPIGLLLTALTPNVIVVNPNATVPINHHPLGLGNFNLHTKKRSNSEKTNEIIFNKNLNEISNLLLHNNLKTTLTNSKCIERAFCELSRKADNSNTEKLKELLELIVKRNQGLQQVDDSMFELVETAKNNNCLIYQCDENIDNV